MSVGILSSDGLPLSSFSFSLRFSSSKEWDVKVTGRSGVSLKSIDGANVFYYGRFSPLDSWTSLSSGLDLSAYDGQLVTVHLKVETNEATTPKQQTTRLYLQ